MQSPPLILLSGMGADERVFAPQLEAFPQLVVPRWIEPKRDESLGPYAARFAAAIDPKRPCFVGGGVDLFGSCSAPTTRRLLRQLSDSDAAFLRWATRAVLTWRPDPTPLAIPIHHIHGDRDHVLPCKCTRADHIIPGAGHVLSLTHAGEVNAFLRTHMALPPNSA